jgi:hypothetical protein
MTRTYTELIQYRSFEDRFEYLSLRGQVGESTFGFDRWLNQQFYTSRQWRDLRHHIIVRDEGCDLGVLGYEVYRRPIIHHMNPLTVDDIVHGTDEALDPEFLILTSHATHNAIHYGDASLLPRPVTSRAPGDTQLWTRRS